MIKRSWVMYDSIWSHYLHLERSVSKRGVTWPITGGQKWSTFLKSLNPNLPIDFVTFILLPQSLSHVIGEFSHCEGYKFTAHAQYHVTHAYRFPKTTRNNFTDPELSFHYTTFMGLWWRLRVVLYWSIPMLKLFSAAKKSSQNWSPKWQFFGNLRV